jgi:hypothetical protein
LGATDLAIDGLYLILPVCGGMEIPVAGGGVPVRVVTPATPVARALLGKMLDDEVMLPGTPPRPSTVRSLR